MPLYQYSCPNNHKFEAIRLLEHREMALCLTCGRMARKVLSIFNFTFGWRISDRSMNVPWTPRDELVRDI